MTPFALKRPATLADASAAFTGDAAWLAGGHTLIPAMKARLRAVETLIDLSQIPGLDSITRDADRLVIGAMVTHAAVASSPIVKAAIPGLSALAALIGDPQVRNRGTIGGSIANNDPAADYPAALLALDAIVETTHGTHTAADFFQGMFTTALAEGELVTSISFRIPAASTYAKHRHPASRYALAGVYVARFSEGVRVTVTGATTAVTRWPAAEAAINAGTALPATLESEDLATDIHASAEFRAHLASVMLREAVAATA